jgi:hypothetical protein
LRRRRDRSGARDIPPRASHRSSPRLRDVSTERAIQAKKSQKRWNTYGSNSRRMPMPEGEGVDGRVQRGLGLGLALARHFVELHGGTISADSAGEGRGATFTVTVPVDRG